MICHLDLSFQRAFFSEGEVLRLAESITPSVVDVDGEWSALGPAR